MRSWLKSLLNLSYLTDSSTIKHFTYGKAQKETIKTYQDINPPLKKNPKVEFLNSFISIDLVLEVRKIDAALKFTSIECMHFLPIKLTITVE